ncbi:hypothetical protein [Anaplasma phagocytophilum]|uniref:hypothetical protein n=1 Tax=Anaplasma phagocytophilum TaxID=948 RepID=UPI000762BF99|nr:hypothetical protein [Anaplasma phagocytophilum]
MDMRIKSLYSGHLGIHPRIKPLTPLPGFDAVLHIHHKKITRYGLVVTLFIGLSNPKQLHTHTRIAAGVSNNDVL